MSKTSKIIFFAIMVALSAVLSYFDSYICSFITFGAIKYKLGLAREGVDFVTLGE